MKGISPSAHWRTPTRFDVSWSTQVFLLYRRLNYDCTGLPSAKGKCLRLKFLSAQKSAIPDEMIKRNDINMLTYLFCVAPMLDWTGTSQKAKHNQHLRHVSIGHVVPNAVPSIEGHFSSEGSDFPAVIGGPELSRRW
jgi:hypothetical protein